MRKTLTPHAQLEAPGERTMLWGSQPEPGAASQAELAMRFATIRTGQGTTAARLEDDVLIPLDAADVGEMLARGGPARPRQGARPVPVAEADFAPVVPRPGKVICVGLNYRSHILETVGELPRYPTLFAKYAETLMGPNEDLVLPSVSQQADWRPSSASSSDGRHTGPRPRRPPRPSPGTR